MGQQLEGIAVAMRTQLADVKKGWVQRALFGGLSLVLEKRGQIWRLAIGRQGRQPSATEARIVGEAFGLPAAIEWSWGQRKRKKLTWWVAECVWEEVGDVNN